MPDTSQALPASSGAFEVAYAKIFGGTPRDARHRQDCLALWESAQPAAAPPAYLVIMEGGPDDQVMLHIHDSHEAAEADFKSSSATDGFHVAPVVEIPAALAAHGDQLHDLIESVVNAHSEMILSAIDRA